jgi:hypothetical protein
VTVFQLDCAAPVSTCCWAAGYTQGHVHVCSGRLVTCDGCGLEVAVPACGKDAGFSTALLTLMRTAGRCTTSTLDAAAACNYAW